MVKSINPINFGKALFRIVSRKPRIPPTLSDNPLLTKVLNRRSVRTFSSKEIPEDIFAAILEAGRVAPSTVNLQTWTFGVFDQRKWSEIFGHPIPFQGNKAIIVMGDIFRVRQSDIDFPSSPLVEYTIAILNASLAAMNMNIAAEALGVSSVMLSETGRSGILDIAYLKEQLHLPQGVFPLMTIVFGYAKGLYPIMPPKLPLEQIIYFDHYPPPDNKVMSDWLEEMIAGYKASHLDSSFQAQLKVYQSKIKEAEKNLRSMVFSQSSDLENDQSPIS
jgi:nitroreductase